VDELIRRLLSTDPTPAADGIEVLPSRRSAPQSPQEFAEDVARYDFDRAAADPSVMMRIGLITMHAVDTVPVAELTAAYYEASIDRLEAAFDSLLERWARECVPPLASRELARVQQALLVGFVLQDKAVTDDPPAVDVFQRSMARILLSFTRPVDPDVAL